LWRQVQADVFGQPVQTVAAEEGAAYGAAVLAGVGAGVWPDVDVACERVVRVTSEVVPGDGQAVLARQYRAYQALYPALTQVRAALS
jgi:xylulokinase